MTAQLQTTQLDFTKPIKSRAAVAFAALDTAGLSAPGAEPSEETWFWVE